MGREALLGKPLQYLLQASSDLSTPAGAFILALALCHTVVIEAETGAFQSESPDEEALVKAASDLGWAFRSRSNDNIVLESVRGGTEEATLHPNLVEYRLLATIPFDSTRKRMSVVVRGPDGKPFILCKGADNIILDRCIGFYGGADRASVDAHLDLFACDGLRTLLVARRDLTEEECRVFLERWSAANTALVKRGEKS